MGAQCEIHFSGCVSGLACAPLFYDFRNFRTCYYRNLIIRSEYLSLGKVNSASPKKAPNLENGRAWKPTTHSDPPSKYDKTKTHISRLGDICAITVAFLWGSACARMDANARVYPQKAYSIWMAECGTPYRTDNARRARELPPK